MEFAKVLEHERKILMVGQAELIGTAGDRLGQLFPANYSLSALTSEQSTMKYYETQHPDLIILLTDGVEDMSLRICHRIRAKEFNRHTGIIFLSAAQDPLEERIVAFLDAGGDDFVRSLCSDQELIARIQTVLRQKLVTDELRLVNHRLKVLSMTDDLTGIANMRQFNVRFSRVISKCREGQTNAGIIMMDLDYFKSVNDTADHLMGSFVLCEIGKILRARQGLSTEDIPARYGGDEFIILSHGVTVDALAQKAIDVRRKIEESVFEKDGIEMRLTCSLGAAWVDRGFSGKAEDIIKSADMMLYRSKEMGRNRVNVVRLCDQTNQSRDFVDYVPRQSILAADLLHKRFVREHAKVDRRNDKSPSHQERVFIEESQETSEDAKEFPKVAKG